MSNVITVVLRFIAVSWWNSTPNYSSLSGSNLLAPPPLLNPSLDDGLVAVGLLGLIFCWMFLVLQNIGNLWLVLKRRIPRRVTRFRSAVVHSLVACISR